MQATAQRGLLVSSQRLSTPPGSANRRGDSVDNFEEGTSAAFRTKAQVDMIQKGDGDAVKSVKLSRKEFLTGDFKDEVLQSNLNQKARSNLIVRHEPLLEQSFLDAVRSVTPGSSLDGLVSEDSQALSFPRSLSFDLDGNG